MFPAFPHLRFSTSSATRAATPSAALVMTPSILSGGNSRSALNTDDWVAGTLFDDN